MQRAAGLGWFARQASASGNNSEEIVEVMGDATGDPPQ